MRYLLTGDSFNAQVALDLNLITEVVETSTPNAALERALSLAESIAQAAPLAVQATLASAQQAVQHGADYAFAHLQAAPQPTTQNPRCPRRCHGDATTPPCSV